MSNSEIAYIYYKYFKTSFNIENDNLSYSGIIEVLRLLLSLAASYNNKT